MASIPTISVFSTPARAKTETGSGLSMFQQFVLEKQCVRDVLVACRVAQIEANRFNAFTVWRSVDRLWLDIEHWEEKGGQRYGERGARWARWAGFATTQNWHPWRADPFIRLTKLGERLADDIRSSAFSL